MLRKLSKIHYHSQRFDKLLHGLLTAYGVFHHFPAHISSVLILKQNLLNCEVNLTMDDKKLSEVGIELF